MKYICEHCLADLGEFVEEEAQPHCEDHPDGVVRLVESDDADSQP